jgi:hypothetical protein
MDETRPHLKISPGGSSDCAVFQHICAAFADEARTRQIEARTFGHPANLRANCEQIDERLTVVLDGELDQFFNRLAVMVDLWARQRGIDWRVTLAQFLDAIGLIQNV